MSFQICLSSYLLLLLLSKGTIADNFPVNQSSRCLVSRCDSLENSADVGEC